MNKLHKLMLLFLTIILIAFIVRMIIYNNYIERITKREHFTSDIYAKAKGKAKDLTNADLTFDNNISEIVGVSNLIYSDILGFIYVITETNVLQIKNEKIIQIPINDFLNLNKPIKIDGGFYNHLNNTLNIFDQDKISVHIYDFKERMITATMTKRDFFNIEPIKSVKIEIKSAIIYFNKLVIFTNTKKIIVYDLTKGKFEEDSELIDVFEQVPLGFSGCFINFIDLYPGIPTGTPTFIRDGDVFTIDLKTHKLMGPRRVENGFITNTNSILVKKTDINMHLKKSGMYRVFLFGAGIKNGGAGGLIFNDIYIKNKSSLSIICGTSGNRMPVKGKTHRDALSKVYSFKLPFNGSCSGSGGTLLFIDNKLKAVAGGGGGWSSELVRAPSFCDSERYNIKLNGRTNQIPKMVLPIKKIIIITELSRNNNRYKINITDWDAQIFNIDNVDLDVSEVPIVSGHDKKYKYETAFSNVDESAQIEFSFQEPISDYKIRLDYEVLSTSNTEYSNTKVIIIDEQYRKYTIDNFNFTFNYKYITAENLLTFLHRKLPDTTMKDNATYISNGCNSHLERDHIDLNQLVDHVKLYESYNPNSKEGEIRYITLKGGGGGGGHSLGDRNSNNIIAAGGGGFQGGKTCFIDETFKHEYSGGCGGTSYIDDINFDGDFKQTCDNLFVNNVNFDNGYVVFQIINNRVAQTDYKKSAPILDIKQPDNNFSFLHEKVNTLFTSNNNLTRTKLVGPNDAIINDTTHFDFNENSVQTSDDFYIMSIDTKNTFNSMCYGILSSSPFSAYIIGWNSVNYTRYFIKNNGEHIEDNLSNYNHGFSKLNSKKMNGYLTFLMENNIYSHKNSVSFKSLKKMNNKESIIKKISSFPDSRLNSIHTDDSNSLSGNINLITEYETLYIVLRFNNKVNKDIKYVLTKYDNTKDATDDILSRTLLYL